MNVHITIISYEEKISFIVENIICHILFSEH